MTTKRIPNSCDERGRALELRLEGVRKGFGEHQVIRGVDLEVRAGELLAIVGGSGCGKTVLMQTIIGHHEPEAGKVLAADHEIEGSPLVEVAALSEEELDRLRRHWAVVFQKNALFSGSVLENIGVWLREIGGFDEEEIRRRAIVALEQVGFEPDDVLLAKHRDELSGGMAKRVAVARAVAMNPILMIFDEPTTGLDPALGAQIHELILELHRQELPGGATRTTLIISHDKDLLWRLRPRVLMLDRGVVHLDCTYEEFERSDSAIVRPYFALMPELHARPVS